MDPEPLRSWYWEWFWGWWSLKDWQFEFGTGKICKATYGSFVPFQDIFFLQLCFRGSGSRRLLSEQTPEVWVLCSSQSPKGSLSSFPGLSYHSADNLWSAAVSVTLGTAFVGSCQTSWKPDINGGVTVTYLWGSQWGGWLIMPVSTAQKWPFSSLTLGVNCQHGSG